MAYQAQVPGFGVAAKDTKVLALRGMRIPRQCYSAKIGWQVKTIIPIKLNRITGLNVGCSMIFFPETGFRRSGRSPKASFRDHALESQRQQIAQQRRAGAKKCKRGDRDTGFKSERKRLLRRVERAEYLDKRGRQTDAGALGQALLRGNTRLLISWRK
jgi:hypothetical protein